MKILKGNLTVLKNGVEEIIENVIYEVFEIYNLITLSGYKLYLHEESAKVVGKPIHFEALYEWSDRIDEWVDTAFGMISNYGGRWK